MKNKIIGIVLMSAILSAGCILFGEHYTPQQLLGYKLIDVVKNNNISEFQNLFANNVIEKFKERNEDFDVSLQKVLDKYREKFFKRYKEFQDSNFYFNYQGTETEGDLYIFFNEQRSAKKPIILENEEWVFNKL